MQWLHVDDNPHIISLASWFKQVVHILIIGLGEIEQLWEIDIIYTFIEL